MTRPLDLSWRPGGWPRDNGTCPGVDPSLPLEQVVHLAALARAKKKRREPLSQYDLDLLLADRLLRDCYATPRWVWRLAGLLAGVEPGGWEGDPFHNPWSAAAAEQLAPSAWTLDGGNEGFVSDGLATWHDLVEAGGAEEFDPATSVFEWEDPAWPGTGPVLGNGPHSDPGAWVKLCARAGRLRIVAAVVPSDAVSWYIRDGMTCDAEVQLGRVDYDPPLGLYTSTGNERCSSLLLWIPETRIVDPATGRPADVTPAMIEVEDDRGKLRRCPLRPGLRTDPPVLKLARGT